MCVRGGGRSPGQRVWEKVLCLAPCPAPCLVPVSCAWAPGSQEHLHPVQERPGPSGAFLGGSMGPRGRGEALGAGRGAGLGVGKVGVRLLLGSPRCLSARLFLPTKLARTWLPWHMRRNLSLGGKPGERGSGVREWKQRGGGSVLGEEKAKQPRSSARGGMLTGRGRFRVTERHT